MQLIQTKPYQIQCANKILDLSYPHIMGVLNVTPDSFSDGGQYTSVDTALQHAKKMISEGATIIDIGGESTRPNATSVSMVAELERILPVIHALKDMDVILSVDTSDPEVMRQAFKAGAHIWNDVRALKRPKALEMAAALDIPIVLMHMRGEPHNMNDFAHYDDVLNEIIIELQQRVDEALKVGVRKENIILDPGFGFAKNVADNMTLLNEFWRLSALDFPILSGLSRKRFIGAILDDVPPLARDGASVMAHLLTVQQGASIVRTHNVGATKDALKVWQHIDDK